MRLANKFCWSHPSQAIGQTLKLRTRIYTALSVRFLQKPAPKRDFAAKSNNSMTLEDVSQLIFSARHFKLNLNIDKACARQELSRSKTGGAFVLKCKYV